LQLLGVGNFSEDFDTTPVGSASKSGSNYPSCWSYIDTVTTGYGYVVASTPQSTPNVYRLYRTNATAGVNQELVLVSPQTIDLGNGTKQLRFSVRSYSTTTYINKLEILSMPSNTSTAGATVLATINSTQADQVWQEYIVPLPATTDDYFGFRLAYNGTTTASSVIIDDVHYEDLYSCFRPVGAAITKASATSVNVSVTPNPLNTGSVDYEYEVRTSGIPGSGGVGLVTNGTSNTPNFTVSGLQAGLVYTIYIRTVCGPADESFYSSYEFGIPASLPYNQDFEGQQHGWVLSNGSSVNNWVVGSAVNNGGTQSLYISNDNGVSNNYTNNVSTVVHAYKDFEIPTGVSTAGIAFDWRAQAESCCDYIRVWLVPTSFIPTTGTQITAATDRINLSGNLNLDMSFKN